VNRPLLLPRTPGERIGSTVRRFALFLWRDNLHTVAVLWRHRWKVVALVLAATAAIRYLGFNVTPSMAAKLVYIARGETPQVGDLVIYHFEGEGLRSDNYIKGKRFFKRVVGFAGATITVRDRDVYVDGVHIGRARAATSRGDTLEPISPGVIPPGYMFVRGDTEDSFDSRYAKSGLVRVRSVVGVAHVIF
jgi:conjugal transfer pilin signal peptidase TrbI